MRAYAFTHISLTGVREAIDVSVSPQTNVEVWVQPSPSLEDELIAPRKRPAQPDEMYNPWYAAEVHIYLLSKLHYYYMSPDKSAIGYWILYFFKVYYSTFGQQLVFARSLHCKKRFLCRFLRYHTNNCCPTIPVFFGRQKMLLFSNKFVNNVTKLALW